jgi:hypothetical protein
MNSIANTLDTYTHFYTDQKLVKTIMEWECGKRDDLRIEGEPLHGVLVNGMPLFQFLDISKGFSEGGTTVAESENCFAIVPAGFRGGPTFNTMNPVKFSIGEYSAMMSLCHLLIVPKNERIYNALTLEKCHLTLISEMEDLGARALMKLIEGTASDPGSIRWQLAQSGTLKMNDDTEMNIQVTNDDFNDSCKDSFNGLLDGRMDAILEECKSQMRFSFHLGTMASIGYLHMHAYLGNLLTVAHDKMEDKARKEGVPKNTPIDEVIYMMGKVSEMKSHCRQSV